MLQYCSSSVSSAPPPLRSSCPAGSEITMKISHWIGVATLQSTTTAHDLNWPWCACERHPCAAASGPLGSRSPPRCPSAHQEHCSDMRQTLQRGSHWNYIQIYINTSWYLRCHLKGQMSDKIKVWVLFLWMNKWPINSIILLLYLLDVSIFIGKGLVHKQFVLVKDH